MDRKTFEEFKYVKRIRKTCAEIAYEKAVGRTIEEDMLDHAMYKIALLREFLQNELRINSADSTSDWVQGNHNAYEITLELLNTFFKEDK